MEPCYLFVYGSLRREVAGPMGLYLQQRATFVSMGSCAGKLYDLGPYPGLIDAKEGRVRGELWLIRAPEEATLAELDEYEGESPPLFTREKREVLTEHGARVAAWVYLYRRSYSHGRLIEGGDYLADSG
jgi:gamma-glutamylcyclotransferase (GGCT)/AIG2-like uncharacterized protein YtfP